MNLMMKDSLKIVLGNYRYFVTGGPERYMFSITDVLESKGHTVIPFSVDYKQNEATPYRQYFVKPPGDGSQIYFQELKLGLGEKLKAVRNSIYSSDAKKSLQRLIDAEKPDVVYLLMLHNVLSPSVISGAASRNIPVVMRLSEYHLMCPAYHFFRDGKICEDCKGGYFNAFKNSCLHGSKFASAIKAMARYFYDFIKVYDRVKIFVTPSKFMQEKLIEYGFDSARIRHIPTFVDAENFEPSYEHENYIVYFGRLTKEKGVFDLIRAVEPLDIRLIIIGDASDGEDVRLKEYVAERNLDHIKFVGFKKRDEAHDIIRKSMFTVCPSLWYENTPNTVYESLALGKPVIGTNIGSIPEQIEPGEDGDLFELGNVEDLREKILSLSKQNGRLSEMGRQARKKMEEKYNAETHYEQLMNVFQEVM